jgi:glutaredoxin-like protein NrdH
MTVTVYSRPGCQPCKLTIRELERLGIDYVKLDVTEHPEALETCKALGYMAAPVVVAGDQHWAGFRPDRIKALAA